MGKCLLVILRWIHLLGLKDIFHMFYSNLILVKYLSHLVKFVVIRSVNLAILVRMHGFILVNKPVAGNVELMA